MSLQLRIGGNDIDLFKTENIVLNAVTKDLKDPAKVFSDYSQQFTVPATRKNNKFFEHFYMFSLEHSLDIRKTIESEIYIDTRFFRRGRVVLLGANIKNNKVNSYKLQFIGELSSLTGALGESKIKELNLNDSSFNYNRTNVALRFSGFTGGGRIIFTLLSSQLKYFWDPTEQIPETDEYINLAIKLNYLKLSPSVLISYLFNKIAEGKGLEFVVSNKVESILNGLYLFADVNSEDEEQNRIKLEWMPPDGTGISDVFSVVEYGIFGFQFARIAIKITPNIDSRDYPYRIIAIDQATQEVVLPKSGEEFFNGTTIFYFNRNDNTGRFVFYLITDYPIGYNSSCSILEFSAVDSEEYVVGNFNYQSNISYDVSKFLPDMTMVEFVSSLVKLWNLVIIPEGTKYNFYTHEEWMDQGVIYDINNFIDVSDYNINRETLPKMFDFSFNENDSFLMKQFRDRFGRSYGDLKYTIEDKQIYTSDSKEIDVSFDNAVFERISNQETGSLTPISASFLESNQKLIHYAVVVELGAYSIDMGGDPDDVWIVNRSIVASHRQSFDVDLNSTVFGEEIDDYTNTKILNTLYRNHYEKDVSRLYSPKTRKLLISAIVPTKILLNIKNNDKIRINGDVFEIDKMTINLTTQKVDFELSFYAN